MPGCNPTAWTEDDIGKGCEDKGTTKLSVVNYPRLKSHTALTFERLTVQPGAPHCVHFEAFQGSMRA